MATFVLQAQCWGQSPFAQPRTFKTMPMNASRATGDDNAPDITFMKLGPQKAFNSVTDLYGTWMVNYSNGTQQYFTITIRGGLSSGQVVISGWWIGSLATDITASASVAGGSAMMAPS